MPSPGSPGVPKGGTWGEGYGSGVVCAGKTRPPFRGQGLADEGYSRLFGRPPGGLAAEGVLLPAGMEVTVVEATERHRWLVLPPKRAGEETLAEGARLAATC